MRLAFFFHHSFGIYLVYFQSNDPAVQDPHNLDKHADTAPAVEDKANKALVDDRSFTIEPFFW